MRSTIPSRFASSDSPVRSPPQRCLAPRITHPEAVRKSSVPLVKEGHQCVPERWWSHTVQYEKQDEYRPPIEVIFRLRVERETHVVIALGWKQHFQCSKRVHEIVGRKNILDLAVRLR